MDNFYSSLLVSLSSYLNIQELCGVAVHYSDSLLRWWCFLLKPYNNIVLSGLARSLFNCRQTRQLLVFNLSLLLIPNFSPLLTTSACPNFCYLTLFFVFLQQNKHLKFFLIHVNIMYLRFLDFLIETKFTLKEVLFYILF